MVVNRFYTQSQFEKVLIPRSMEKVLNCNNFSLKGTKLFQLSKNLMLNWGLEKLPLGISEL